jgi:hypothetical protein
MTPRGPRGGYKYKKEYPEDLIKHMAEGLSFESFAGHCKVSVQCLFEWVARYDEFAKAKAIAEAQGMLFWERIGRTGMTGKIKNFVPAVWIFTMKCRFRKYGWRDDPQQDLPKDQTNEARNLLVLLRQTVQDTQCQQISHTVSPSPSSKSLSQSGLLMASREISSTKSPEEPQILKSDTTE